MTLRLLHAGSEARRWIHESLSQAVGFAAPIAAWDPEAGAIGALVSKDATIPAPLNLNGGGAILREEDGKELGARVARTIAGYLAEGPGRWAAGVDWMALPTDPWLQRYDRRPESERIPWVHWGNAVNFYLIGPQSEERARDLAGHANCYPSIGVLGREADAIFPAARTGSDVPASSIPRVVDFVFAGCFDEETWVMWARPALDLPRPFREGLDG